RLQALDLVDREERGLAPVLLHLLGEPLEVFLVLRSEGQEVDGVLERDRSNRPQSSPRLHAEARRMYRQAENQDQPGSHRHTHGEAGDRTGLTGAWSLQGGPVPCPLSPRPPSRRSLRVALP